ncbi:toll/interleukin-1 receptor domain-containing protein [Bradyrhizobium sp. 17]|uniref:toll/interleukin-1 receptor domain-containing protein n=1 Tax=Bradyrhizobium sp. 17 TaxID=2782649 RepID=UPI001FF95FDA
MFFSYCHADEALRDQIEKQLSLLKRQGVVETWHDRRIEAGQDFAAEIDCHIETDDIILLLVSSDFLSSDYCYEIELKRAMERHEAGDAIVIPVILRACDWHGAPFGKLNATPPDGKPITQFPDRDQAMLEVAKAIRVAVARLKPALLHRGPHRWFAYRGPKASLASGPVTCDSPRRSPTVTATGSSMIASSSWPSSSRIRCRRSKSATRESKETSAASTRTGSRRRSTGMGR